MQINAQQQDGRKKCHMMSRKGLQTGKELSEMTLAELQQFSEADKEDVFTYLTLEGSVAARNHIGGTAPGRVRGAVGVARELLDR